MRALPAAGSSPCALEFVQTTAVFPGYSAIIIVAASFVSSVAGSVSGAVRVPYSAEKY